MPASNEILTSAMRKIDDYGNGIEIWFIDGEFWVYGVMSDPAIRSTIGGAREVAARGV